MNSDTLAAGLAPRNPAPSNLRDLVCVAICTCDRHGPLRETLASLESQSVGTDFRVVVVDNGREPARGVVEEFADRLEITYERVETPGLTPVRNRSLALARTSGARFLACIDDDETADRDWLRVHLEEAEQSGADLQTGFVEPCYLAEPPGWIVAGDFYVEAAGVPTTANLLLRLSVLPEDEAQWFSPTYSATGGEDYEFITRLVRGGARYRFSENARVTDRVPAHRLTLRFILRRGLRDGVYFGLWAREEHSSAFARAGACLVKAGAKLGYAVNHLFWSPGTPWRARRAGVDLATALGIAIGAVGIRLRFYGHSPHKVTKSSRR